MPSGVANELEKIKRSFLWGDFDDKRKLRLVDWNTICKRKECGGLGIISLNLLNDALLLKWPRRFSTDSGALWREVICNKYNFSTVDLWPKTCNTRHLSRLWGSIQNTWVQGGFSNFIKTSLFFCADDGSRISFWNDEWIKGVMLKTSYPRIFALATNEKGVIKEFGSWIDGKWTWTIQLRRSLFDWDINIWRSLLSLISTVELSASTCDKVIWTHSSNGIYSPKSFRLAIDNQLQHQPPPESFIWSGIAPPKVEILCWKAIVGKLPIIDLLHSRGRLRHVVNKCVFCELPESISHLFCHCPFAWNIWSKCVGWWKIN